MKLSEIANMIHPDTVELTVNVFTDESERDAYRAGEQTDALIFSVKSPHTLRFFLSNRFADSKVLAVCPVSANEMDFIIEERTLI